MATKPNSAPVQSQVSSDKSASADAAAVSSSSLADAAASVAKVRAEVIDSLTFEESFGRMAKSARWHDVISAASAFAKVIEGNKALDGEKPSVIARKAATVAPVTALALRVALVSYSLAGRTANATQLAELSQKLPMLATKGALKDKAVTFGGIVLPPLLGEI